MKFNMKSFASGFVAAALTVGIMGTAWATVGKNMVEVDYNNIKVSLNGEQVALKNAGGGDVEPFAINGTTYLPVRAVADALGLKVGWDQKTTTVILTTVDETKDVYITKSGSKYHNDSTCNGGTYWPVSLETAVGMGLEPCSKCVQATDGTVTPTSEAFKEVNENQPFFSADDLKRGEFETYSELDSLGRCGVAFANISPKTMPTEERGEIGMIKPSGWHTVRYDDLIEGKYLYNRCHLIGFQLAGENANEKNLITGTRYLNIEGMLPFENMIDDYVDRTGNHVLYRVTPDFQGSELVARGVQMEAYSVEDNGAGICFNVYAYNIQPGVEIDYATGESHAAA